MKTSSVFTIILDYDGGTYIAQQAGEDVLSAVMSWAATFDLGVVDSLDLSFRGELEEAFSEDEVPALLDGLSNVWCCSGIVNDELALLHVVRTVSAE